MQKHVDYCENEMIDTVEELIEITKSEWDFDKMCKGMPLGLKKYIRIKLQEADNCV